MSLNTFVKINAVNNLSDARYGAGMGVQLMGFCLDANQPTYIPPGKFIEITGWVSGVEFVAEFGEAQPEQILATAKEYPGLTYLEIKEELCLPLLLKGGFRLIWRVQVESDDQITSLIQKSEFLQSHNILVHLVSSQLVMKANTIHQISALSSKCDVLVGFGITTENVLEVLENTGAKGISIEGGEEIKPGLKDFDSLADILELLEVEE